jgi:Zn-finger protein
MFKNPSFSLEGDLCLKYYDCPEYERCLDDIAGDIPKEDGNRWTNWSCQECDYFKNADGVKIVQFYASGELREEEILEIEKFERENKILCGFWGKRTQMVIDLLKERGPMTAYQLNVEINKSITKPIGGLSQLYRSGVIERTGKGSKFYPYQYSIKEWFDFLMKKQ